MISTDMGAFLLTFSAGVASFLNGNVTTEANTITTANLYPTCGIVTECNIELDIVTFADFSGNLWSFNGVGDWIEGDRVAAIMNDNGTPVIYDDEIVSVKYCGWVY